MTLLLAALLAQAPPPDARPEVVSVELRLPLGADPKLLDRVPDLVAVRKGQRLSRRSVQRSIESLFATGRFGDVVARVEPVQGGVEVVFDVTPRLSVREVYVEGNQALTKGELIAASRLAPGVEFWPERAGLAAEAVAELYWRRGYRSARVTPAADPVDGAIDVGFVVEEGQPERVAALAFSGEPGLGLPALREAVRVAPGDLLDLDALEKGADALRELLRRERYYRARVEPPVVLGGGRVVLPVVAGPRYELVFSGNRSVADTALRAVLGWSGEETLDLGLEARLAQRLVRFYRFRGFHDARVTASEVLRPGTREAALGFEIDEGLPLRVVQLDFEGNTVLSDRELRDVLATVMEANAPPLAIEAHGMGDAMSLEGRTAPVFARSLPSPPPATVLEEQAWAEAVKAMGVLYRERGYLTATVKVAEVAIEGQQARARFVVTEGPQARVRSVAPAGLPPDFTPDALSTLKPGDIFSLGALDEVRQGVARELGRKGYLFAAVRAQHAVDETGRHVDCVVQVDPGVQVRVRRVLAVGAARTAEEVVLGQAAMQEGEPLDAEAMFTTQANLQGLGIFRTVEVEMLGPERPEPLKTVLLKVRERPRISGEFGLGYFLAEGPRIVLDVSAPNLAGRAINFTGHAQFNFFAFSAPALSGQVDVIDLAAYEQIGGRGTVSVQNRGVLPANIGWRLDMVGERVFRPQFRFTRFAGVPSLDWSTSFELPRIDWARPKLTVQLQYELEWARVQRTGRSLAQELPLTLVDQERLRFLFGSFALQTVKLGPTFDLRDNALVPRKGVLVQGTVELTGAITTADVAGAPVPVNFVKASGLASVYLPVTSKAVVALSARAGRVFPLAAGSVTPPVKRFFLGGATSMRGFNEDQLIAEDSRERYRAELRECLILAVRAGCSSAARTILGGKQVPSQGGELFALLKAEVRFPALSVFDLGVFVESGNLWLAPPKGASPLRVVAGTGLRYVTPIGPLALDLGVNLAPDGVINEPSFVAHFNIGVF